jgi:hypothetical protein
MVKKKSKPEAQPTNGKSSNVAAKAAVRKLSAVAVVPPVQPPSFRDMKCEMEDEVREFRNYLVGKYSNFYGRDMRKDVAWFMEQMGIGIASDIERVKREERQKLIAENQAKEAADNQPTEK